ncbi:MAG: relaxase/mobilization nuclease domain-containing protein [Oscillospiraceae bacterium]|nr:relaxase/mobilization nuclease domain-containing protein [Oscillospiraceae bacterium]
MATTRHMTRHVSGGKTIMETLKDGFDYGQNPDKTRNGDLVMSYECDPRTADAEFLLSKAKYKAITGREQKREKDVLYYHQRQAFPPGEVDAETALKISYETALRWTKGNHAFFVVSHIDRPHPHCHIYYNSTSLDCSRKFRDFLGSAMAFRRLSDRVCLEKSLSIVERPKLHSKGKYKHYGQWVEGKKPPTFQERLTAQIDACLAEGPGSFDDFLRMMAAAGFEHKYGRGGVLSFRNPAQGQERFTRLRADTLGVGYGPEDIRAVIEQGAPHVPRPRRANLQHERPAARLGLVIDIQARMRQGKGPAYEQWAKIHNLKQMAAALQYLQENGIAEYSQLAEKATKAADRFHTLEWQIKSIDSDMQTNAELRAAVADYAKTRPVFDGYKAAKYSGKYLAEHRGDIDTHRAARATFTRLLNGGKLPRMDALKNEYGKLAAEKKAANRDYKQANDGSGVGVNVHICKAAD